MFYQDFKDTFVCNTQLCCASSLYTSCCFIRISKILLYAIHNIQCARDKIGGLFYQDFKDTFVCNTQRVLGDGERLGGCFIRISKILLYAIHNMGSRLRGEGRLFYQDFKDTFVCNTQHLTRISFISGSCFIRISKILLYAIHNTKATISKPAEVVLSGFQRYFCMQYTTRCEVI